MLVRVNLQSKFFPKELKIFIIEKNNFEKLFKMSFYKVFYFFSIFFFRFTFYDAVDSDFSFDNFYSMNNHTIDSAKIFVFHTRVHVVVKSSQPDMNSYTFYTDNPLNSAPFHSWHLQMKIKLRLIEKDHILKEKI